MSRGILLSQLKTDGLHPILCAADGTFAPKEATKFSAGLPPGEWFIIGPADLEIHPSVWNLLTIASRQRPDVGIFYGDDVAMVHASDAPDLSLKPDWDLSLELAKDYIGLPIFVRSTAAKQIGDIDLETATAASFDLLLRGHAAGVVIGRIPQVLAMYPGQRFTATHGDRISTIRHWWPKNADAPIDVTPGLVTGSLRINKRFTEPPEVTLVVPTRQTVGEPSGNGGGIPYVLQLLDSLAGSDYPMDRLHVVLGDDVESDAIYSGRQWPFNLRRILTRRAEGESFNYAAKMNRLWREASTENVILMNDDITICAADWIQALLSFSTQTDVGGVGARLLYPSGEIQHAGMPGGVFGLCAHAWIGEPAASRTYQDWASVHREWSIVTGAVFATRKSLLEEVNGFDERFRLDFNDVDLCLKLKMLGYRIVYTPHAELIHHEKGSRGDATWPPSELALFLTRWAQFLDNDPAFHPLLSKTHHTVQPLELRGQWWQPT